MALWHRHKKREAESLTQPPFVYLLAVLLAYTVGGYHAKRECYLLPYHFSYNLPYSLLTHSTTTF
jgi:hypothetical protein